MHRKFNYRTSTRLAALSVAFMALASSATQASSSFVESVSGDLSNDSARPTPLTFTPGSNTVAGRMGIPPGGAVDPDFFTFTIAPGTFLSQINLTQYMPDGSAGSALNGSFFAIASGTSINTGNPGLHLSNRLVPAIGDILPGLAVGPTFGGTGLAAQPGAGTYTVWFQETATTVAYTLDFVVTPVPEPTTLAVVFGASGLLLRRRIRA